MSTLPLSIVVPAYNESAYLPDTVNHLRTGLMEESRRPRTPDFEIIVVENGSSDNTRAVASALADEHDEVVVRSLPRRDYGAALRAGINAARGRLVACFDADFYDLDFLDTAVDVLDDADMVLGSKRVVGSVDSRPWARRFVTAGLAKILHAGFGLALSDTHGMKVMRRSSIRDLVPECRFDGELFDTELVIRAVRSGRTVVELPVVVAERRPPRTSLWRRLPRAGFGLVRLRLALAMESG